MHSIKSYLRCKGFTLIELLVSVTIVGILSTIAVPFVQTTVKREKERELKIALREIRQAIDRYKLAVIQGKIAIQPEQSGYPPSLLDLVIGVDDITNLGGGKLYFLRKIPRDPFYSDGKMDALNTWGLRSYQSSQEYPEEGDDVFDVYSTSSLKGLNGIAYSEW